MIVSIIKVISFVLFPFRVGNFPELDMKLRYTLSFLLNVAFLGLLCIVLLHVTTSAKDVALSLLTALALFAIGNLAGFILALPRIGTSNNVESTDSNTKASESPKRLSPIGFNNNLVDISDWITKSILTLSIANYRELIPSLQGAAGYLAIGTSPAAHAEVMVIIIGYLCIGILYAYISTRTLVTLILLDSANSVFGHEVSQMIDDAGRGAVKALDLSQQGDEPKRTIDTISPEEKMAATAIAGQTAGLPAAAIEAQVNQLAKQYSEIRANQKPGADRTTAMEEIAGKLRALGMSGASLFAKFKDADQAGLRLAAVSILEMKPNPNEAEWLIDRLTNESPFIGYHAAVALRETSAVIDCKDKEGFLGTLNKAAASVPATSDRATVITDAIQKLKARCPD